MQRLALAAVIAVAAAFPAGSAIAAPPGSDGAFNLRLGGFFPSGDSDFWEANEAAFTLDHSDFNGAMFGVGYTASVNNYFEVGFGADFYWESVRAADRNFNDQFGNPILHDTRLGIYPFTVDFKVLPGGRYAIRGSENRPRYVRRPVPYLGGGIGMTYWQYEEEGDFVASDLSIVYDRIKDSGFEFERHVMAGIEFPLSPSWNLTLEGRYSWAEATPGGALAVVNPGKLDLGGAGVFVGGSLRF